MTSNQPTFPSSPTMRAIAACVRADVPVMALGEPGEGKSAQGLTWGRAWDRHVEVITGSNREASDFLGLPTIKGGRTSYAPLSWVCRLNEHEQSLLILEEFTCTSEDAQKAMLRGLQERVWGDTPVTSNCPIILIGNPDSVAVGAYGDLPAPIANRMCHLDWSFDFDEWGDGFLGGFNRLTVPPLDELLGAGGATDHARVRAAILQFLRVHPKLRREGYKADRATPGRGWYSPRSWTNAASALAQLHPADEEAAFLVLKGTVGEAAARSYLAWVTAQDLYDPAQVMADPSIVHWATDRPDRLYVLVSAITSLCQQHGDPATWAKGMAVMNHAATVDRIDTAWPGARALLAVRPRDATIPAATVRAFGPLMKHVGLITDSDVTRPPKKAA